jgi:hypothetical protein
MGYIKNHAILVTTYDEEKAKEAHSKSMELLPDLTTELKQSPVNSDYSFAILPDGSKEGWPESQEYDILRNNFCKWLRTKRFEDGSSPYKAVLVYYDEEDSIGIQTVS